MLHSTAVLARPPGPGAHAEPSRSCARAVSRSGLDEDPECGAPLVRPRPLRPGARIGLVAPGSAPAPEHLARGIAYLESAGYRVVRHRSIPRRRAYLAGPDRSRAQSLHDFFADDRIDAVFCAAGGYGSLRLLPHLDSALIARHPKVFLGFSDITALHVTIQDRARLVTFHGPTAAATLGRSRALATRRWLWRALTDPTPLGELPVPGAAPVTDGRAASDRLRTLCGGTARGRILAGNLSVLCSMLGSPWQPDVRGKLLFLEETTEHPCRLDEMLAQMEHAGLFGACAGVVIARLHRCSARDAGIPRWDPLRVLADRLRDLGRPVLYGLEFGHTSPMVTLPCGVMAELDAGARRVRIIEPHLASA
jgi:muramoyltetrapeptide carboxypeptidase